MDALRFSDSGVLRFQVSSHSSSSSSSAQRWRHSATACLYVGTAPSKQQTTMSLRS